MRDLTIACAAAAVFLLLLAGGHRWLWPPLRNTVLPGTESARMADLDPALARALSGVLGELNAGGFEPRVAATWRSPERQDFVFELGAFAERLGGGPSTRARGGQSCHNAYPALAVDVVPARHRSRRLSTVEQARFYRALGRAAKKRGLRWGGDWSKKNAVWRRHSLGWDPAHVEVRGCAAKTRVALLSPAS